MKRGEQGSEWQASMLEQMDRRAADYDFPILDNVNYPFARARLGAYRSEDEWLVTFQVLAWEADSPVFVDQLFAFGNRLRKPGLRSADEIVQESARRPLVDDDGEFAGDLHDFTVVIRGRERHMTPSSEEYSAAGINLRSRMPAMLKLIRLLAHQIPDELFIPEGEVPKQCGRRGLSSFLQLGEWEHPDVTGGKAPSASGCLRSLAAALAAGDRDRYECPEKRHNTHWSRWKLLS